MPRYHWPFMISLVAPLTLGLLWPVPVVLAADSPAVVTQTLTYANGDVYVGETVNGKRQGEGVYTYKDGRRYTGAWQDDKRQGQGTMTFPNGDKYVGEFPWPGDLYPE
jgi:MORN repeat